MPSGLGVCLGGLCCGGCAFFALRSRRPRPAQRYMTVVDDEEDEQELLHEPRFSVGEGEEPDSGHADLEQTPRAAPLAREGDLIGDEYTPAASSRESWIAEMNAELAEFDVLTSPVLSPESTWSWEASLEDELGQRLATPRTPKTP